eukprot:CAMPEP_0195296374 /NCGR_PEP_ID=MMETSP0707-20130614/19309_1 /TAXON_ID=33640 /ORGANISM="Asterionellopsis glacialis, Strain CCMP134" /LENGTH=95 /DNA_ID=CAMNT_0040357861 /DNA_START=278 /DNA_END=562 /DNA_ORIENTATION=-
MIKALSSVITRSSPVLYGTVSSSAVPSRNWAGSLLRRKVWTWCILTSTVLHYPPERMVAPPSKYFTWTYFSLRHLSGQDLVRARARARDRDRGTV